MVFEKNWLFILERMSNSYCCPCETGLKCKVVKNQSEIVAKSFILKGPKTALFQTRKAWSQYFFLQEQLCKRALQYGVRY